MKQDISAPDLSSPGFKANPYPFYARLREEFPVWRTSLRGRRTAWLVTRYGDVARVLKDDVFVKDRDNVRDGRKKRDIWMPGFLRPLERNMLDLDDPDHARLRSIVSRAFTPRLIENLRGRIEEICETLLDDIEEKRSHRTEVDIVSDFALPLPATVIAELLGVPARDHPRFHRWSNRLVSISSNGDMMRALPAALSFMRYLRKMADQRRRKPSDDLISALVEAERDGDRLDEDELLAMTFLLLVAGHETTVNLISGGILTLLENPQDKEDLREDPQLMKPAIEELLRYTSPVEMATERYAREDVELAGSEIPCGELVLAVLGSANRDERYFTDPDELDLAREPNRHVAFGRGGVHHCLGAPLARMEGGISLGAFLRRFPDAALTDEPLRYRGGLFVRGLRELPLKL